jgi:copper chaperone CopZ
MFQNFNKMAAEFQNEKLEKKAVDEILKETSRAAVRAEVGGALSWTKPKHKGINKRFLNNTMFSTIIQNTKTNKQNLSTTTVHHSARQKIETCVEDVEGVESVESVTKPNHQAGKTAKTSSKVVISSKGRYKAYLADFKHKKEIEANREKEAEKDQAGQQNS